MKKVAFTDVERLKELIGKERPTEIIRLRSVTGQETKESKIFSEMEYHPFEDEISFFCHNTGRAGRSELRDFLKVFDTRHFDGVSHIWDSYYIKTA